MLKHIKNIFIISVFIIGFTACENDIAVVNSITSNSKLPSESGKDVEIIYSDSALVRAKLTAPQLDRYAGKKSFMVMPKGMEIVFYNKQGVQETKLNANYGIGFDNGTGMEHMEAKGNVIVINEKGERLNTEHLIWNTRTKKIYTEQFVKITTKEEAMWGDGLEANEDFSDYTIKNPKGSIKFKE
ncbi:MAG: LPS export ABC transporter periplasmic protein LptC [Bacteroidetes bacterium]|nr:LPS export ABC transporter periplasmic protein LptC [Bacteroidota bacterium]